MRCNSLLIVLTLSASLLSSCRSTQETSVAAHRSTPADLLDLASAEKENVILSPLSLYGALDVLLPGAKGQTLAELQAFLPDSLTDVDTAVVSMASSIWLKENYEVRPSYLQQAQADVYRGIVPARMNDWAAEKTHGRITKVMGDEPMPLLRMVIMNALYFKDAWRHPFEAEMTEQEPFYGQKQETRVMMMHQTDRFEYQETKHYQAIRLPYVHRYYMEIVLPREGQPLASYLSETDKGEWQVRRVALALPRFELSCEREMNKDLQHVGVRTCFTDRADFSALSEEPVQVSLVKQNTFLRVDEAGTEAAAVTSVLMRAMMMPRPEQPVEMTVCRPFFFAIRDSESHQVLFYGFLRNL